MIAEFIAVAIGVGVARPIGGIRPAGRTATEVINRLTVRRRLTRIAVEDAVTGANRPEV